MFADSQVVHVKVDLSQADAYDELFPPSLFTEPASQLPDVRLLSESVSPAAGPAEVVNVADEAFEDVEEINPFVGKTKVSTVKLLTSSSKFFCQIWKFLLYFSACSFLQLVRHAVLIPCL